jgi:5-methylcytosine-specific restriction endonuclease McrA
MTPKDYKDRMFDPEGHPPRHCWMCGCHLTRGTATVDHLIPIAKGGGNTQANFRLACAPCNNRRGHKPVSWVERMSLKGKTPPQPRTHDALAQAIQRARNAT